MNGFKIVWCWVSFSPLDFDSDNMEFGKVYFNTLSKIVLMTCLTVFIFCLPFFKWISLPVCPFLRGRSKLWSTFSPLILLVPSVRRNGHLRPGAGQQYLQEALSGEVHYRHSCTQIHKSYAHLKNTFQRQKCCVCVFVCVQAVPSVSVLLL